MLWLLMAVLLLLWFFGLQEWLMQFSEYKIPVAGISRPNQ